MSEIREVEVATTQLQLLLVGGNEEDSVYLRDLFARIGNGQVWLEYAHTQEDALALMEETTYDVVLYDYQSGDGAALRLVQEIRRNSPAVPVAFLGDHVDEESVATAIRAGAALCLPAASLNQSSVHSAICSAIDVYCKERQRQKAEGMLSKLWSAVEQTADMVAITDRSGVMEYVNPAFEALTGYSRAEAIGRTLRILKSRQQAPGLYQEMWRTILAGEVFRGIVVNCKKGGETFVAEKTITPLRDTGGEITHFISTDRDITERRRLESQLQQAQKMDAIGRLAGGVAHDFNNLLMVISAYAELMLDSLAGEHPLRRNVEEIMGPAHRAADLTHQLLAFGRKQMQALQVLDLNAIVQEIGRMLPRLIGEDIQLNMVAGKDVGRVKADRVQIEQVVMNLAANARDAMPHGGTLTIETGAVRLDEAYVQKHSMVPAGDYVLLTVTDSGQGIAPEHLPHIFEPFYTTKKEGKGTGLGLATVYGIVKQSSGFIWVYSELAMGTTFKIYLPRVRREVSKLPPGQPAEIIPRGSETLLLVEDEKAVRAAAREFLGLSGYTVLEAENGEDGLRVARDYLGHIHLMVTDVIMPRMGGAKLAEQLAAERPQMKVLFLSGYAESTILQHGAIDMAARFLQKPFTLTSLARKIREILQVDAARTMAAASSQ
jgi:two-component system cell cycle sensor histidine kinase/response regulator CckA